MGSELKKLTVYDVQRFQCGSKTFIANEIEQFGNTFVGYRKNNYYSRDVVFVYPNVDNCPYEINECSVSERVSEIVRTLDQEDLSRVMNFMETIGIDLNEKECM